MSLFIPNIPNLEHKVYDGFTPKQHTQEPIVVGGAVVAILYGNGTGALIVSDTQCNYGKSHKFKDVQRITKLSTETLISSGGEYSDFQEVTRKCLELDNSSLIPAQNPEDKPKFSPSDYGNYISKVKYQWRNKMDPKMINSIIIGHRDGKAYLANVDPFGTYLEKHFFTTGFATYFALPLIEKHWRPEITLEEAQQLLEDCMRNIFYRDCGGTDRIQYGIADASGVRITEPKQIASQWKYRDAIVTESSKVHQY